MSEGYIDHPMRTFIVVLASEARIPPDEQRVECVRAHTATIEHGALVLIIVKGGLAYIAKGYAAGTWAEFDGSIPTDAELNDLRVRAQQTVDARQAFADMPVDKQKQ